MRLNYGSLRSKLFYGDCQGSLNTWKVELQRRLGMRYNPRTERFYIDYNKREMATEDFCLPDLAETFLTREFCKEWGHGGERAHTPMATSRAEKWAEACRRRAQRTLTEEACRIQEDGGADYDLQSVMEEGVYKAAGKQHRLVTEDYAPAGADLYQDINAFTATVSGLVEVRILEAFQSPDFIAEDWLRVEPTRVNGGKVFNIMNVAPNCQLKKPGEEFANVDVYPLFCWAFEGINPGYMLSLDRYAVLFDISGELLARAGNLGYGLGYALEYYRAAHILGLQSVTPSNVPGTNMPTIHPSLAQAVGYKFLMQSPNGADAPNATYQTAGNTSNTHLPNAYNFINKQTQSFADWQSLQKAQNLLNLMRDPVNSLPFKTEITHVLVDPAQWQLALYVKHQTEVLTATGTPATAPFQGTGSTLPPVLSRAPGYGEDQQSELNKWRPYHSNIWHQVWLDGGVSEANAEVRWLAGDPQKAFRWRQIQDLLVQSATPTSADMLSRNIVNLWTGQWYGQFVVEQPRYVILNTE